MILDRMRGLGSPRQLISKLLVLRSGTAETNTALRTSLSPYPS